MYTRLARRALFLALAALLLLGSAVSADGPGFITEQPPMLQPAAGASVRPILTVGDTLPNGYRFESIPDGIGILPIGQQLADVFVAHETSLVPFPITYSGSAIVSGLSDFDNAQVSRLRMMAGSGAVLSAEMAITSEQNYQRFCSAFLATDEHGFRRPIFFANEEATDYVSPPPLLAWPPDPSNKRQAGLVVALDARNDKAYEIYGMGRFNHENTIVIPGGWNEIVTLSGDDTFSAPSSQLYMYTAASDEALLADAGSLWAFVSDNPSINDYGDLVSGSSISGHFIPVPREIAVGDQTPLEDWSNANNVFQFIRIEDLAYDRTDPRVVYFADTGEPRAIPNPATGRLGRGPSGTQGPYPNGRIFKMVLNAADPKIVDSLSVLIDADAGRYNNPGALHNPDNVDTSTNSLMIQEDPGSHNNYAPGAGPSARVWRYDLNTGTLVVVAEVDQSLDPAAREGTWESSGIVDASALFGPGTWLVNVQAHSLFIETETRIVTDTTRTPPATGPITFKREGGQLLVLTVPGS